MKRFILILLTALALPAFGQFSPPAASQAEVNAGTVDKKYVSPKTLASVSGVGRGGTALIQPAGAALDTANIQAALDAITNTAGGTVMLYPTNHYSVSNLTIYANTIFDANGSTLSFISGVTNFEINIDKGATETVTNISFINFVLDGQSVSNFVTPTLQAFLGANFGLWPYYFDVSQGHRQMPNRSGILANAYAWGKIRGTVKGFDGFGIALFNSKGNGTSYNFPKIDIDGCKINQCFYGLYLSKGNTFDFPASWGYQVPSGAVCANQVISDVEIHQCAVGANLELYSKFLGGSLTVNDIGAAMRDDGLIDGSDFNHDGSYAVVFAGVGVGHLNKVINSHMYAAGGILDITGNSGTGKNVVAFNTIANSSFNLVSTNQGNWIFNNNLYGGLWNVADGSAGIKTSSVTSTNFIYYDNVSLDTFGDSDGAMEDRLYYNFVPSLNQVGATNRPFPVVTNNVADHKPTNWWFYYNVSGVAQSLFHNP